MPISMFYGTKYDYIQVVVLQPRYHERLMSMGWKKTTEELGEGLESIEIRLEDFELHVMGMDDKEQVSEFIKSHFGVDLDKRGSLDTIKDKAIGVINESRSAC